MTAYWGERETDGSFSLEGGNGPPLSIARASGPTPVLPAYLTSSFPFCFSTAQGEAFCEAFCLVLGRWGGGEVPPPW